MRAASSYSKIGEMWPRSNGPVTQNGFELKGSTLKMSYISLLSEVSGISVMPIYKEQQSMLLRF